MSGQSHKATASTTPEQGRRLARLIDSRLLTAVFQPIVDVQHGCIAGCEALTRPAPDSGFTNAGELFDAAGALGREWDLELIARGAAFASASAWPADVLLFMNCSPAVFADPRFPAALDEGISRSDSLSPTRVVLEVTERSEQQAVDGLLEHVNQLRARGFQIAIDDVGAGASGLNRIMSIRPGWLKLDRDLVSGVDSDRVKQNLIRFIMHFGRQSGVHIIAEGIETRGELETLAELGVGYGQGYFLARPAREITPMAPDFAESLRNIWASAGGRRYRHPRESLAERFARAADIADASRNAAQSAPVLLREKCAPGLLVTDAGRLVGWCSRERVVRAAADKPDTKLTALARPCVALDADTATIAAALETAAARDDLDTPIVLLRKGAVAGLLTPHDLIRAASEAIHVVLSRTSGVTGLPGRVRCDQHVRELIMRNALGASENTAPDDAAFIDVRDFAGYNWTHGHEMGDELIRRLVALVRSCVETLSDRVFVGHLGDDRLLLTAPTGVMRPGLERLVREFDDTIADRIRGPLACTPGIRVLLLPGAFGLLAEPQGLFTREAELRRLAAGREHLRTTGSGERNSMLLIDEGDAPDAQRAA